MLPRAYCELSPLELLPDHELPDQELPDQEFPDQLLPDHELPLQELPLQELPDQTLPFQVPPLQEAPAASSSAIEDASNAWPKMSISPWSTTPSRVRWSSPRETSSEPVPVPCANRCDEPSNRLSRRRARSRRPLPCALSSAPGILSVSDVRSFLI